MIYQKIQLKASIPSTCSSVNISGHMFACNGKTTTKTCLLHIYTIHQLWTQDSNQYNCNDPLTNYVLPFFSQWNVPCTPLYLMSDTKVIVLWLKRWVIPNDTQPENLVKPDEEFRTLQLYMYTIYLQRAPCSTGI